MPPARRPRDRRGGSAQPSRAGSGRRQPARGGGKRGVSPRQRPPAAEDRFADRAAGARPKGRSLAEQVRALARPGQGDRAVKAFEDAVSLLERDRVAPALTAAEQAKALAPRAGPVREVLGMALYRAERYRDALRELQAYRRMTGRIDQNHLIADSYRAIGAPDKAIAPVQEVIRSAASDQVRSEAAIVGASALADAGRYAEALSLLRAYRGRDGAIRPHDLRRWYVAGDVLERAGRSGEAAQEFRRIVRHDSGAFDAAERLARLD
jgi:tetratricopeptide (TPR) repeat protein